MQHKNDVDGDDDDDDDANRGKKRIDRTKGSLQMRRGMRKMKQIFCTIIQDRSRCSCSVVGVLFILLCAVLMQFYILSHHTDTPNPVDRIRFYFATSSGVVLIWVRCLNVAFVCFDMTIFSSFYIFCFLV